MFLSDLHPRMKRMAGSPSNLAHISVRVCHCLITYHNGMLNLDIFFSFLLADFRAWLKQMARSPSNLAFSILSLLYYFYITLVCCVPRLFLVSFFSLLVSSTSDENFLPSCYCWPSFCIAASSCFLTCVSDWSGKLISTVIKFLCGYQPLILIVVWSFVFYWKKKSF